MRCGLAVLGFAMVLAGGTAAATIDEVRGRDRLICGVSEGLRGFSEKGASGAWSGFDVDFCRAVAAAVLGDATRIDFVPLSAAERFKALTDRKIDLLSRNSTWTMSRDLKLGLEFAGISYYDGQGFLVPALYAMTSPLQLGGARICVVSGTTTEENAKRYFAEAALDVTFMRFEERDGARAAYAAGTCDAYTADRSALAAERSLLPVPDDHIILSQIVSKEPLGPVTRDDDRRWTELVRWILFALVNAEELELDAAAVKGDRGKEAIALGAPAAEAFGLPADWMVAVIASVGNYAEIFERNIGAETPLALRRGPNALWSQGGLLYAPPMH